MLSKDALRAGVVVLAVTACLAAPASAGAVNAQVADDFFVSNGAEYAVGSVDVDGFYDFGGGPISGMNVFIYANNSGTALPQDPPLFAQLGVTPSNGLAGPDFTVPLTGAPLLSEGRYWISVQARLAGYPDNIWDWANRPQSVLTELAAFQTPDGQIPACTTWQVRTSCTGFPAAPDQAFMIRDPMGTERWNQLDMPAASGTFSQIDPPPPPPAGGGGTVTPTPATAPPVTTAPPKKCKKGQKLKKGKCVKKGRKKK